MSSSHSSTCDSEIFNDEIMENLDEYDEGEYFLEIKEPEIKNGINIEETDDEIENESEPNTDDREFISDEDNDGSKEFFPSENSFSEKTNLRTIPQSCSLSQEDDNFSDFDVSSDQVSCFIFTDVHFSGKNPDQENKFIEACTKAAKKAKPDFIVDMGDLLHWHNMCDQAPFNRMIKLLNNMREIAPVYKIIGNHELADQSEFQTSSHFYNLFKQINNITIVDKAQIATINDFDFFFTPYVPKGTLFNALNSIEGVGWDTCIAGFGHQEIKGAKQGAYTSEDGDEWEITYPPFITGHFHEEQVYDNVLYPGSSIQTSFGETHKKYVWKMTFDGDTFDINKIDLKLRSKKTFYVDIDKINNFDLTKGKTVDIRLNIKGTLEQMKVFRKSEKYLDIKKAGIKIVENISREKFDTKKKSNQQSYQTILLDKISKSDAEVKKQYKKIIS